MNVPALARVATARYDCPTCGSAIEAPCRLDAETKRAHRIAPDVAGVPELVHAERANQLSHSEIAQADASGEESW